MPTGAGVLLVFVDAAGGVVLLLPFVFMGTPLTRIVAVAFESTVNIMIV